MANSRRTFKPKFRLNETVVVDYAKGAPGYSRGDVVRIIDTDVKQNTKDPSRNRYLCIKVEGVPQPAWFSEDYLWSVAEAREEGF